MTDKIFETPTTDTTVVKAVKYDDNPTATGGIVVHIDQPKTTIRIEMWENLSKAKQTNIIAWIASNYPTLQAQPSSADK